MTKNKTILVVDDDSTLRAGMQTMLQRSGYRTLEAEDGVAAKDLINKHKPDLVILDMMMPRWSGFQVLEHFQNNPAAPPFIMLSAKDSGEHKAHAKQMGAVDYLQKPYSMERLLNRIDIVLRPPQPAAAAEPPMIRVTCRGCGARIKAPKQLQGQTRPCPGCKQSFVVRAVPLVDEGPRWVAQ